MGHFGSFGNFGVLGDFGDLGDLGALGENGGFSVSGVNSGRKYKSSEGSVGVELFFEAMVTESGRVAESAESRTCAEAGGVMAETMSPTAGTTSG